MILDDLIKTFHRLFGLNVIETTSIKRGWLNLKWKVTTDAGEFLLKQYNKERYKLYNPEELLFAFSQQIRLYDQGLACPPKCYHRMKVFCLNLIIITLHGDGIMPGRTNSTR
ncbi:hypothetical protein D3C73_1197210 [compost metagenome]